MANNMSIEEARELAELTDRIVCNLKTISDDANDLYELFKQTGHIVAI